MSRDTAPFGLGIKPSASMLGRNAKRIHEEFRRYDAPLRAAELLEELAATRKPVLRRG